MILNPFRYRIYILHELIAVFLFDIIASILLFPRNIIKKLRKRRVRDYSHENIKKILLFRTDRIGDLIMTLPAIKKLRSHYKKARIDLVTGAWNKPLLEGFLEVDRIYYWNPSWITRGEETNSFTSLVKKALSFRKIKYDIAIDFSSDVRINMLMWLMGAPRIVGYADSGGGAFLTQLIKDEGIHRIEQNLKILNSLGIEETSEIIKHDEPLAHLKISQKRSDRTELCSRHGIDSGRKLVVIHPWGGRCVKTWSTSSYAALLDLFSKDTVIQVVLTGTQSEKPFVETILKHAKTSSHIDLSGKISLREMMSLISNANLFISPDTGPAHIAAALGTSTLTLFGPSDMKKYAPYGQVKEKHKTITAEAFNCKFCNRMRKPPRKCIKDGVAPCMAAITPQTVYSEAVTMLKHETIKRRHNEKRRP